MVENDGLLGLAVRAQRAVLGAHAVQRSLRRRQAVLVLLAEDAGPALARKMVALGLQAKVPVVSAESAASLGRQVGRERLSVAAFEDEGFARSWQARHEAKALTRVRPPSGSAGGKRLQPGTSHNRGDVDE